MPKCNQVTKLCVRCDREIYTLNRDAECEPAKTFTLGENYYV